MKKIIAAAVATAFVAPAFAADITISGDVEYTMATQGSNTVGNTGDADFFITASEDLGNGLSVTAYVGFDDATTTAAQANRESKLTISGDFGSVAVGNDAGDAIGSYDEVADVAEAGAGATLNDGFSSTNGIVFTPNTGVEGLNFAISYTADNDTATGNDTATSYAVQYDLGVAKVFYGSIDEEGADYNASVMGISGSFGPIYVGAERIKNPGATINTSGTLTGVGEGDTLTSVGITYDYGVGKLAYETNNYKDDSAATEDSVRTAMSASYKIGAVNTYIAVSDAETNSVEVEQTTTFGVEYAF
jgi:hypothetical protein